MTEHTANEALHAAAHRIEWEDAHAGAWMAPAPKRQQRSTKQRNHAADYVALALLVSVVVSLIAGVL